LCAALQQSLGPLCTQLVIDRRMSQPSPPLTNGSRTNNRTHLAAKRSRPPTEPNRTCAHRSFHSLTRTSTVDSGAAPINSCMHGWQRIRVTGYCWQCSCMWCCRPVLSVFTFFALSFKKFFGPHFASYRGGGRSTPKTHPLGVSGFFRPIPITF